MGGPFPLWRGQWGALRAALSVRTVRLWRFHLHFALLLIIILIVINAALRIGTQVFGTGAGPTRVSVKNIRNYVETDRRLEINQWLPVDVGSKVWNGRNPVTRRRNARRDMWFQRAASATSCVPLSCCLGRCVVGVIVVA